MFYAKYTPSAELKPFVHCYYIWESKDNLTTPLNLESPPPGYPAMVLNYGDPYYLVKSGNEKLKLPNVFINGQITNRFSLSMEGKIQILGIVFTPTGLYNLFQISLQEICNIRVDLSLIIGRNAGILLEKISESKAYAEKIELVECFIKEKLDTQKLNTIDIAANHLDYVHGAIKISDLCEDLNISTRYLQKSFLLKVGISPKFFSKIKRIGHICYLLTLKKEIDWQDIVYQSGYYDQAHFIKDFKFFMNRPPNFYFQDNKELVKYL